MGTTSGLLTEQKILYGYLGSMAEFTKPLAVILFKLFSNNIASRCPTVHARPSAYLSRAGVCSNASSVAIATWNSVYKARVEQGPGACAQEVSASMWYLGLRRLVA